MENVDKRQAILEAAAKRFSTYGFHETKVGDIAEDVGIAKGTVYLHFKDKETLLQEVVRYYTKLQHQKLLEAMAPHESAAEKLRALARLQISRFPYMVKFNKLNYQHMMKVKEDQSFAEEIKEEQRAFFGKLVDVIQYGIDRGEFRKINPTDAAIIVSGALFSYIHSALIGVVEEKDEQEADALMNLVIQGLER
jgi:TetR/AcrR family fatty acid metabolism transcriptional regulator